MSKKEVLVTGASGEVGHGLINSLAKRGDCEIVALDLRELAPKLGVLCKKAYAGDIGDEKLLQVLETQHQFDQIYHLAGMLSATGEKHPMRAHEVNVNGSINMLRLARAHARRINEPVQFLFTSTIAVYGLEPGDDVNRALHEREFQSPTTMYGINKWYIEKLGSYFATHPQMQHPNGLSEIDFRCLRFPGIISPDTLPSGGTSDYGPEMLHAAAKGDSYSCFVKAESRLPFMVMPDGINALLQIAAAPVDRLQQRVYNINSFSVTAQDFKDMILRFFPKADIRFEPVPQRQAIVDSWPRDVDDSAARRDWNWSPQYDFESSFRDLLVPKVKEHYGLS